MQVKVGDKWYEATVDEPIMVVMTEIDKQNIANMAPDATKYAIFDDADVRTKEDKLKWMRN